MRARTLAYCSAFVAGLSAQAAAQSIAPAQGDATFRVFLRGSAIGTATSSLTSDENGWVIRGTSRLGAPLQVSVRQLDVRYSTAWHPRTLTLALNTVEQEVIIQGVFQDTLPDRVDVRRAGQGSVSPPADLAPDAVILPNLVYSAYEALAVRLSSAEPGDEIRAYVAPQGEIAIRANSVTDETIQTADRTIRARRWSLTFFNLPNGGTPAEVWTDGARLARFDLPTQALTVIREDLAALSARVLTAARPNDEEVFVQASGFNLAATISKPTATDTTARRPAVILVGSSEAADRNETIAGVSIFGGLANTLADRGFLVVRFDRRGMGQSGGRPEAATLDDFADDVRAVVRFLHRRADVDRDRVAVFGHGEGGWVGLLTARREGRVNALILAGVAATTGAELVLEQQRHMLAQGGMAEADRQEAMALQKRIVEAVLTGDGWDTLAAPIRRQADTAWYRSLLTFDPLLLLRDVRQPVLVVHGELDRQVPVHHAGQLAQLARSRPRNRGVGSDLIKFPTLNHLLVPATTGEVSEYATLPDRSVSGDLAHAVADWLAKTLPPRAGR